MNNKNPRVIHCFLLKINVTLNSKQTITLNITLNSKQTLTLIIAIVF